MKKIVILISIFIIVLCIASKNSEILIPNEAIRIRIIANSDSVSDQKEKAQIKNEVTYLLNSKLKDISSYNDARKTITNNISEIKNIINKYSDDYEITYGKNYFPEKEYKGVNYSEGDYESLVIKLGDGKGKNFWCVLFPPLCLIDEENLDNISYKFYINEILKKIK